MKTFVINTRDDSRVPFLRGILTRSLMKSGLQFEDAFSIATDLREALDSGEITSDEVRAEAARMLEERGEPDVRKRYVHTPSAPSPILVVNSAGETTAFSRGSHTRELQSSGMDQELAGDITNSIYDQLLANGVKSITDGQLGFLTYRCLLETVSPKAARRYLIWSDFQRSGRPLLLLIGGAVGTGKSTVATEIAHLLDIVRIQSTDMLREVMRMMIPERLLPVLHTSSFSAGEHLPVSERHGRDAEDLAEEGYRVQTELLALPCEAVMKRAVTESVPLILEGVHVHPDLLDCLSDESEAIMVHVTLAVLKRKKLKKRLRGRSAEVSRRIAERYLDRFEAIWAQQSFLLSEADRCNVPIITNEDRSEAILQIIRHVNYELGKSFNAGPKTVFGPIDGEIPAASGAASWRDWIPELCELREA